MNESPGPGGSRRAFNRVRRSLEDQRLALTMLVRRLEPSLAEGRWLIEPEELREELERARRALTL